MHFQKTQIWRGQDQQLSNLWATAAWPVQTKAVTAFSPAPWIPTPYYLLPAPQGLEGRVQGSRTFSLFLPAPPRPFWESLRTGLPTSWQPIKSQLWADSVPSHSHARIQDDDPKSRASPIFCKSLAMWQSWERKGREAARCARPHLFTLLRICIQFLFHCRSRRM